MKNNRSIVLVELILIIVALGIIVFGITSYISQGLLYNLSNINQEKALFMAQAGVMKGLADYNNTGEFTTEVFNVAGEFWYKLGKSSSFLLVDASTPKINKKNELWNIPIRNLNSTNTITVTGMVVEWSFGGNFLALKVGGSTLWSGTLASPATVNLSPVLTLNPRRSSTPLWGFSNTPGGDVICTFIFSDGSRSKFYLLKNGGGCNNEFRITATGEIRSGASVLARRTLIATYDAGTAKITSWEESQSHIIP